MNNRYDLIVLGGGPAGYLAAERAAAGGLSIAVIEKNALGGVCLNEGCIPTKTLIHSAKIFEAVRRGGPFGVHAEGLRLEHSEVLARKDAAVRTLVRSVNARLRAAKVTVINAAGKLNGRTQSGEYRVAAGEAELLGNHILIASGSVASLPPIPGIREGLESGFVCTSRELLSIKELPKSMTIIGGGVIGLEMASYFCSAGVFVTVIEALKRIGGPIDPDIAELLLRNCKDHGIEFHLSSTVTGVEPGLVRFTEGGAEKAQPAELVCLAVGRNPAISGLGLETVGVATERGAIPVDEHMRTNVPNIYAAGDCVGGIMLAHVAYREAEAAVNHMLGRPDTMRYCAAPSVIYTCPEVAGVGETEESANAKGFNAKVIKLSMRYSGRYVAESDGGDGICKLIVDSVGNRLLGVHMIGPYVSENIYGAGMMIESGWTLDSFKRLIFPHPTVCEIIREALFSI